MKNDQPMASEVPPERKPYVRPSLLEVPLRMEEAVLGFCKTPGNGPLQSDCTSVSICSSAGS